MNVRPAADHTYFSEATAPALATAVGFSASSRLLVEHCVCRVYDPTQDIHLEKFMRTNIDLDDELIAEAMAATGLSTKKATVEEALRLLVLDHRRQAAIADMAGLGWEGDLDQMRQGRNFDPPM
jgi:Arc/MetJ family transcription regulator